MGARHQARRWRWIVVLFAAAAIGCADPAPGTIEYGTDACDHCRMTIADPRFAGQLVTRTGKVYRFDDPRCLANFAAGRVQFADVHSIWLNDYDTPPSLVHADRVVLLSSDQIRAPMNGQAAAFATRTGAQALQKTIGGRLLSWQEFSEGAP